MKSCKLPYIVQAQLSFCLKVESLNGKGKYQPKEHWDPNDHYRNGTQKVMSEPEVTPDKIFYCFTRLEYVSYISILRSNQSVQGPSNRASPVVPAPPYRNPLSRSRVSPRKLRFYLMCRCVHVHCVCVCRRT